MEGSTHHKGQGPQVAPEFGTWPIEGSAFENANTVRAGFDNLLKTITPMFVKGNERYLSIVKSKLEEACFFSIKGVTKPGNGAN